ncbi:MAG: phenylacetate--CoA ligase family protein [Candidatus Wallbacteria bacterium]|nr:phenylacetate--CoA ligase family protein [Candidatus Wallbacteria bacterium]
MSVLNQLYLAYDRRWRHADRWAIARAMGGLTERDGAEMLRQLLEHAVRRVPFYRKMSGTGDLSEFPILRKESLRREQERLRSDDLAARRWYLNSSGGSTGQPVSFVQDEVYTDWAYAAEHHWLESFHGIDPMATRKVVLWGSERDVDRSARGIKTGLVNWLTNTHYLNVFHTAPGELERYAATIRRLRPDWLKGYAGSLYQLARFVRRENVPIHGPRLLTSSAETLRPFMREEIEQAFGVAVRDFYGSREVGPIAGECRRGRLHMLRFHNWTEIVGEDGRPVAPGVEGRVLVTTLHNLAMPLIRYELGDTAVAGGSCDCGSSLPVLQAVSGRITDHFPTRTGGLVHGEFFTHLFYFRNWVEEFQVLQEDLESIRIFVVMRGEPPAADQAAIERQIRERMGPCSIRWERVDAVPRTPSGKLLFTRSLVENSAG